MWLTEYEGEMEKANIACAQANEARSRHRDRWTKVAEQRQHLDWWNATEGIGPSDEALTACPRGRN